MCRKTKDTSLLLKDVNGAETMPSKSVRSDFNLVFHSFTNCIVAKQEPLVTRFAYFVSSNLRFRFFYVRQHNSIIKSHHLQNECFPKFCFPALPLRNFTYEYA